MEKVFPISKSNSTSEDIVTEKLASFFSIGLIFYVVSKNIAVFHTLLWGSVALTDQFSRSQNDYLENTSIFITPCPQIRESVPIIIASTTDFKLNTMQITRFDFQWVLPTRDAAHTTINTPFLHHFGVFFDSFYKIIRRLLWQWLKSYLHWKHQMSIATKPLW